MARTTTKMCTACTKTKPLDDFHRKRTSVQFNWFGWMGDIDG